MEPRLDGKVVPVIGAGGDLGAETVTRMIARGVSVAGLDRDAAALDRVGARLPQGAPWLAIPTDATDEGQGGHGRRTHPRSLRSPPRALHGAGAKALPAPRGG